MSWVQTRCAICGRLCDTTECYLNRRTGEIWCVNCLAIERNRRQQEYANNIRGSYQEIMRSPQKPRYE